MYSNEAVCGACGRAKSDHFCENGFEFCNETTNGDYFTDDPSDSAILDWMRENHPETLEAIIGDWKKFNGH